MSVLSSLSILSRAILAMGRFAGVMALPLMLVIIADVVLRRWFVIGSTELQELEWHLNGLMVLLAIAAAFLRGAHVRIDLLRARLPLERRVLVEFLGLLLLLLPFCAALLLFGFDYASLAWLNGESSPSPGGLPHRWIIKSVLLFGIALLLLAGLLRLVSTGLFLFGPASFAARLAADEKAALMDPHDEERS